MSTWRRWRTRRMLRRMVGRLDDIQLQNLHAFLANSTRSPR